MVASMLHVNLFGFARTPAPNVPDSQAATGMQRQTGASQRAVARSGRRADQDDPDRVGSVSARAGVAETAFRETCLAGTKGIPMDVTPDSASLTTVPHGSPGRRRHRPLAGKD